MPLHRRRSDLIDRRKQMGFTRESLAEALGMSPKAIEGWELGTRNPSPQLRPHLAELLEVSLMELEYLLNPKARPKLQGHAVPPGLSHHESLVQDAGRLDVVTRAGIPALLQTRPYATAIEWSVPRVTREWVERRVEFRLARQDVLAREPHPLQLTAVLHDHALREEVGGREVMADQLQHILTMAELPHISVLMIPADGRCMFWSADFELLYKRGPGGRSSAGEPFIAITTDSGGVEYHERDVESFRVDMLDLQQIVLSADESRHRIRDAMESYR